MKSKNFSLKLKQYFNRVRTAYYEHILEWRWTLYIFFSCLYSKIGSTTAQEGVHVGFPPCTNGTRLCQLGGHTHLAPKSDF